MSYDIWTAVDVGNPDGLVDCGGLDWNYTSNVWPMLRRAMPKTNGLVGLHGWPAVSAAIQIRKGLARMDEEPDEYRALNPRYGWGDFDSLRMRLETLAEAFERVPQAIVQVSA